MGNGGRRASPTGQIHTTGDFSRRRGAGTPRGGGRRPRPWLLPGPPSPHLKGILGEEAEDRLTGDHGQIAHAAVVVDLETVLLDPHVEILVRVSGRGWSRWPGGDSLVAGIPVSDVEYLYQLGRRLDEETILPDPVEPEHGMLTGHVDPDNFGGEIR